MSIQILRGVFLVHVMPLSSPDTCDLLTIANECGGGVFSANVKTIAKLDRCDELTKSRRSCTERSGACDDALLA